MDGPVMTHPCSTRITHPYDTVTHLCLWIIGQWIKFDGTEAFNVHSRYLGKKKKPRPKSSFSTGCLESVESHRLCWPKELFVNMAPGHYLVGAHYLEKTHPFFFFKTGTVCHEGITSLLLLRLQVKQMCQSGWQWAEAQAPEFWVGGRKTTEILTSSAEGKRDEDSGGRGHLSTHCQWRRRGRVGKSLNCG